MLSLSRARYSNQITENEEEGASHPPRRSGNEHSRSIWNVAEFTVASWTTGCSRNASSGKRTTRTLCSKTKLKEACPELGFGDRSRPVEVKEHFGKEKRTCTCKIWPPMHRARGRHVSSLTFRKK